MSIPEDDSGKLTDHVIANWDLEESDGPRIGAGVVNNNVQFIPLESDYLKSAPADGTTGDKDFNVGPVFCGYTPAKIDIVVDSDKDIPNPQW